MTSVETSREDDAAAPDAGTVSRTLSLAGAAKQFFGELSPKLMAAAFLAVVLARILVARWSWWDLVAPAAVVLVQPFTEWSVHVYLLHLKPRRLGRVTIDPIASRKHRAHHLDPKNLPLVFVPLADLLAVFVGGAVIWLLAAPLPIALSGLIGVYGMLGTYEWTHYLIHSTYRPRRSMYRKVWRAHRNHHFRNEHYWFGVTMHLADHVLRTYPERAAVEVSPTARTLGVDVA